jgi:hypothetical protein
LTVASKLSDLFQASSGRPIEWKGQRVQMMYVLHPAGTEELEITFEQPSPARPQALRVRARGGVLEVNGSRLDDVVLWSDSAPESVIVRVVQDKGSPDSHRDRHPIADLALGIDPLTLNRYTYVNGDPVNFIDPTGHARCTAQERREGCYEASEGTPVGRQAAQERAERTTVKRTINALAEGFEKAHAAYYAGSSRNNCTPKDMSSACSLARQYGIYIAEAEALAADGAALTELQAAALLGSEDFTSGRASDDPLVDGIVATVLTAGVGGGAKLATALASRAARTGERIVILDTNLES